MIYVLTYTTQTIVYLRKNEIDLLMEKCGHNVYEHILQIYKILYTSVNKKNPVRAYRICIVH